jgi:hypothetical protein
LEVPHNIRLVILRYMKPATTPPPLLSLPKSPISDCSPALEENFTSYFCHYVAFSYQHCQFSISIKTTFTEDQTKDEVSPSWNSSVG